MRGVNKVILVGRLGNDPEVRYLPSGNAVANISVATSEAWKDKNTGEPQERTEWHRVAIFGKIAELTGQYLHKGSQVYIEGKLRTRKWQGQDGQDRYTTEVIVDMGGTIQFLDSRGQGAGQGAGQGPSYGNAPSGGGPAFGNDSGAAGPGGSSAPGSGGPPAGGPPDGSSGFDDDIPF